MNTISPTPAAIEAALLAGKPVQVQGPRAAHSLAHLVSCELADDYRSELRAILALVRRCAKANDPDAVRIVKRLSAQVAQSCGADVVVPPCEPSPPKSMPLPYLYQDSSTYAEINGAVFPIRYGTDSDGDIEWSEVYANGAWMPALPTAEEVAESIQVLEVA